MASRASLFSDKTEQQGEASVEEQPWYPLGMLCPGVTETGLPSWVGASLTLPGFGFSPSSCPSGDVWPGGSV